VEEWSLAARRVRIDRIVLPALPGVDEVTVALAPDGGRIVLVDGEEVEPDGDVAEAAELLEAAGRHEHTAFVARAHRSADGWSHTVDPL
jgi:hypothetical protein